MASSSAKKEEKPKTAEKAKPKKPTGYIAIGKDSLPPKEAAYIDKLAARLKTDPSSIARAFVRMVAVDGSRKGVGWFAPRVKRFLR